MSTENYPLVGGKVMRLTRTDACGRPAYGNATFCVSDGFVSVAVTATYDDGTEVTVTNANGDECVQRDANPVLKSLSLVVTFCDVDPDLYTAFSGMPKIIDPATGVVIGFDVDTSVRPNDVRNALEVWANAEGNAGCDDDGAIPYGYLLWPFLSGGRVGDYTVENGAASFSVSALITKKGSQWGEGPYDVQIDADGDPGPLVDPILATTLQRLFRTTVAPPEATSGLVPLDNPDDPDATTATAGIPGTWNGVRPETLSDLQESPITGSGGATAWTTGQFVYLGDGSKAHWAGSGASPKWAAGPAA